MIGNYGNARKEYRCHYRYFIHSQNTYLVKEESWIPGNISILMMSKKMNAALFNFSSAVKNYHGVQILSRCKKCAQSHLPFSVMTH